MTRRASPSRAPRSTRRPWPLFFSECQLKRPTSGAHGNLGASPRQTSQSNEGRGAFERHRCPVWCSEFACPRQSHDIPRCALTVLPQRLHSLALPLLVAGMSRRDPRLCLPPVAEQPLSARHTQVLMQSSDEVDSVPLEGVAMMPPSSLETAKTHGWVPRNRSLASASDFRWSASISHASVISTRPFLKGAWLEALTAKNWRRFDAIILYPLVEALGS